jgi:CRISPR/Cas system-associated endonuclease Cas1
MIAVMNQFSINAISAARAIYDVLRQRLPQIDVMIRAKLEPYLGFILSMQYGKPSLVCAFQELYRYLIDGFITSIAKR